MLCEVVNRVGDSLFGVETSLKCHINGIVSGEINVMCVVRVCGEIEGWNRKIYCVE